MGRKCSGLGWFSRAKGAAFSKSAIAPLVADTWPDTPSLPFFPTPTLSEKFFVAPTVSLNFGLTFDRYSEKMYDVPLPISLPRRHRQASSR